ncbi:UNVERIFIED_CONTAM: hypothetical protein GTU68_039964 [Idotea baltica]|nr:hypothetical protein [Idotea baltica]
MIKATTTWAALVPKRFGPPTSTDWQAKEENTLPFMFPVQSVHHPGPLC